MELHGYFRSSASYRVRIGLNLKGLEYDYKAVNLLKNEQRADEYTRLNPQGLVPALVDDGQVLTQSLAILEWLDETHPEPALLPATPTGRARIRALAYGIASDIQPIQNLRILRYLQSEYGLNDEQKAGWIRHWIHEGFAALENQLKPAPFAAGDKPGLFECCLMPQVYSAERFGMDIAEYPAIQRITQACNEIPAFIEARPENQPDSTL
ncbi:maleylacetoacetate isomerase [Microbulbifer flavimaris]|uniref:Maleylacetoacetate isomerase n=1 Tax=Microbulbifer flavimaris TaxID=1781068 RepID=A0ABX4I3G4_9GAMM|nr:MULTISPECIES: maleylacetoacetate isomerase [Microbulbifer]KUJ84564.1 maleylacetoacetate isomerase [Microbulbifer sp. ZGT114]PCO06651.1 maleylacetoacetate isomerase [Microbulbifer flavimaris]